MNFKTLQHSKQSHGLGIFYPRRRVLGLFTLAELVPVLALFFSAAIGLLSFLLLGAAALVVGLFQ